MAKSGTMIHEKQDIPEVLIDSTSKRNNDARIKQEEEELAELIKQAKAAKVHDDRR